jgi:hypothetical protein
MCNVFIVNIFTSSYNALQLIFVLWFFFVFFITNLQTLQIYHVHNIIRSAEVRVIDYNNIDYNLLTFVQMRPIIDIHAEMVVLKILNRDCIY